MAVFKRSGKTKPDHVPNAITQVYVINSLAVADGSGAYVPATSTSVTIKGIFKEAIGTTDARYTTAGLIEIEEIDSEDVFEMLVTGTFTAANIGTYLDLSDAVTVNADASAVDAVECVGYIDATHGLFKINANASTKGAVGSTA